MILLYRECKWSEHGSSTSIITIRAGRKGKESKALTSLVDTDARGGKVVHGAQEENDHKCCPKPAGPLGLGHDGVLDCLHDAGWTAYASVTIWFLVGVVGYLLRRKGDRGSTHVAVGRCSCEAASIYPDAR